MRVSHFYNELRYSSHSYSESETVNMEEIRYGHKRQFIGQTE